MGKHILPGALLLALLQGFGPMLPEVYVTEVVPPRYDVVWDYQEGRAAVELAGKWGFLDREGNEVIPPRYDGVFAFSGGLAVVWMGEWGGEQQCGVVAPQGREVVPPIYGMLEPPLRG